MRYPYRGLSRRGQSLLLIGAVIVFAVAVFAASRKSQAGQYRFVYTPSPQASQPAPESTDNLVSLTLKDEKTLAAISNRSVAFIVVDQCVDASCPSSSPSVFTTNDQGVVQVSIALLKKQPKIYMVGYTIDRYFSFLRSEEPNLLTVYQPLPETKSGYDITKEGVVLGLKPVGE